LNCPFELSCSAETNVNTCCTPSLGLFVFSQQVSIISSFIYLLPIPPYCYYSGIHN
jgi:hypothetical protein